MAFLGFWTAAFLAASVQADPSGPSAPDHPAQVDGSAPRNPAPIERRTPNLELLRVQASFLERDVRGDYSYEDDERGSGIRATTAASIRLAVPIDSDLMVAVTLNHEWLDEEDRPDENGSGGSVLGRLKINEDADSSYAFNLRVTAPDKSVGNDKTSIAMIVSGFEDLDALLGLDRVGVYADLGFQHSTGRGQLDGGNEMTYALSLAKTWGDRNPTGWQVSPFLELAGTTQLDQGAGGRTTLSLTPGLRIDLLPAHAFLAGVDVPLTHPHGFGQTFRISYIFSF